MKTLAECFPRAGNGGFKKAHIAESIREISEIGYQTAEGGDCYAEAGKPETIGEGTAD